MSGGMQSGKQHRTSVGAGLPAMTSVWTLQGSKASSPASRLLQVQGVGTQSVSIRECLRVSFMVMYTSSETAMQAVTYQ